MMTPGSKGVVLGGPFIGFALGLLVVGLWMHDASFAEDPIGSGAVEFFVKVGLMLGIGIGLIRRSALVWWLATVMCGLFGALLGLIVLRGVLRYGAIHSRLIGMTTVEWLYVYGLIRWRSVYLRRAGSE